MNSRFFMILVSISLGIMGCIGTQAADMPETFLQLNENTLSVTAGKAVDMTLNLPGNETWSQANIGRLQVRYFGETQSLVDKTSIDSDSFQYVFTRPGYCVLLMNAGGNETKGYSDSVTRTPCCVRMLIEVKPDPDNPEHSNDDIRSAGLTSKGGLKIEVCPYMDPLQIPIEAFTNGADLPVRVYFEGKAQKNATITAFGPDGATQSVVTSSKGIARVVLDQPGRWLIRYQKTWDDVVYTGDLIFDAGSAGKGFNQ